MKKTGGVCLIDLRSPQERAVPEGEKCPVVGFCGLRSFTYCPSLAEFHRRHRQKKREERAGEMPLTVLIPSPTNDGEKVLNSLLMEGYRRSAILIGGALVIETQGTRGVKRSGASSVRYGTNPGEESSGTNSETQSNPNR